jgi:hypothetical protein
MPENHNLKNILIYQLWKYIMLGKYSFYENVPETNIKHNCKISVINYLGSSCWLHRLVKYNDIFKILVGESDLKFQYVSNFCQPTFTDSELRGL